MYPWECPKGILGVYGSTYGVPCPLGIHRWPDTLSEGVRIGATCGNTGVSSYSRVVFQMSKMAKLADFHDIWESMDRSKIAIFRGFGGI